VFLAFDRAPTQVGQPAFFQMHLHRQVAY
jgi:hypothetical protein